MGTDNVSSVSLSGDEPKKAPQNDFLSTLNREFEKSKAELLDRFLVDQAELNRRFGERSDAEKEDSESGTRSDRSLKETENLLRQRLALHWQGFSHNRARTSIGFYNQTEFKGDDKDSDCSSEIDSANMSNTLHVQDSYQGCEYDLRQLGVSKYVSTLQTCVRPKTSVSKKSLVRQHITAQDTNYSYESVPTQMPLSGNQKTLTFNEFQPRFVADGKNTHRSGRPFRRHSEFSLGLTKESSSSSKLLRPVKWTPALADQHCGDDVPVFCRNRNEVSVEVPFSDSDLQVVVPQTSRPRKYKPDSLMTKDPESLKTNRSYESCICMQRFEKSRRCHAQIRELSMQSNFTNKNGCNKTSYRGSQPMTLVKLPPLKHTVAKNPPGHTTLNPVCH